MGVIIIIVAIIIGCVWLIEVHTDQTVCGVATEEQQKFLYNFVKNSERVEYTSNLTFFCLCKKSNEQYSADFIMFYMDKRLFFKNRWKTTKFGIIKDSKLQKLLDEKYAEAQYYSLKP